MHLVAGYDRTVLTFGLSPGAAADGPEGRKVMQSRENKTKTLAHLIMDTAYEGDETRQLVLDLGLDPVVPAKSNRLEPWEYDRERYRKRHEVERLFRRLKGFRSIFSRCEKLDVMYGAFIHFALIIDMIQ
jgi:transposase